MFDSCIPVLLTEAFHCKINSLSNNEILNVSKLIEKNPMTKS